jgi:uroporphyrinogen decarboxylase
VTKFQMAIQKKPQACPPIWFMRQAGRYHKHYQKIRAKHDFVEMCKNPELAAEVAMGPIDDFDFDVAILFSDLLFPLEALGMKLYYDPGPKFESALTEKDLEGLKSVPEALENLQFQKEAMHITRQKLPAEKSLVGFIGGPWTLFNYAVSKSDETRPPFYATNAIAAKNHLLFFEKFLEVITPLLAENIFLQLEGGADVVMIFDPAAGQLSPSLFAHYVAPTIGRLAKEFAGQVAYYSKETQAAHVVPALSDLHDLAGLGVDHRWSLADLLKTPHSGFTQGNFDQALLFAEPSELKKRIHEYAVPMLNLDPKDRAGWVCGLGHGVLPQTPEENVRTFIKTIRQLFK